MGPGQATSQTHTKGKSSQLGSEELIRKRAVSGVDPCHRVGMRFVKSFARTVLYYFEASGGQSYHCPDSEVLFVFLWRGRFWRKRGLPPAVVESVIIWGNKSPQTPKTQLFSTELEQINSSWLSSNKLSQTPKRTFLSCLDREGPEQFKDSDWVQSGFLLKWGLFDQCNIDYQH